MTDDARLLDLVEAGATIAVLEKEFRTAAPGTAGRLLERLTGLPAPSIDDLVAMQAGVAGVAWIIPAQALADHGGAAVAPVVAALEAFPFPARDTGTWFADESTKYHLMHVLARIGPAAAAATPVLEKISGDHEAYRDSRWKADRALAAIGTA
jgi:hypothetical protein